MNTNRNALSMSLHVPRVGRNILVLGEREEIDSVVAALSAACEALASVQGAVFTVSGFGQAEWPVDVSTDLAVLLEQLPGVMRMFRLAHGREEIDFYEQGLRRTLYFTLEGDTVSIRCESRTNWTPNPAAVAMTPEAVSAMLRRVVEEFLTASERIVPKVYSNTWFQTWTRSLMGPAGRTTRA